MHTEYTITTPLTRSRAASSARPFGLACAASGLVGVAIAILTLSYPAAVAHDRWSYPFGATAQWIVSIVLAITHLLSLAGFVGIIRVDARGRSRTATLALWVAVVGFAGLTICEVLSGAVGTQRNDSAFANAVGGGFALTSLLTAVGSIVAGVAIVRRHGLRNVGWSMVLWSGIVIVLLVTPANISGNDTLEMAALALWSLTFIPLGQTLMRAERQRTATGGL